MVLNYFNHAHIKSTLGVEVSTLNTRETVKQNASLDTLQDKDGLMPLYKITATIEVNTEADDEYQAIDIGTDCMDWANADITVEETDGDD